MPFDWSNIGFVFGNIIGLLAKRVPFIENRLIPFVVVAANFLVQLVAFLTSVQTGIGTSGSAGDADPALFGNVIIATGFWSSAGQVMLSTFVQSAISVFNHQVVHQMKKKSRPRTRGR